MTTIVLSNRTPQGEILQATFLPDMGMNMISYKKGEREVIDQSTRPLFDQRFAGLGALIGPHFHRRRAASLPKIADESLFPHIARIKAAGGNDEEIVDPFSHGIARYAPWQVTATESSLKATLTGKDLWQGVALSALEGQNFTMHYQAELTPLGLQIAIDVVGETDTVVGLHYYYHLPQGRGRVISAVQPTYLGAEGEHPLSAAWQVDAQQVMSFDLDEAADYTFHPFPHAREGKIVLDAIDYKLLLTYLSPSQENCWQLYHPKGASFVCIEPISAQDPRHPNLSVSSLKINLEIL